MLFSCLHASLMKLSAGGRERERERSIYRTLHALICGSTLGNLIFDDDKVGFWDV